MKIAILRDFYYPYGSKTLYRVLSFYFQSWAQNKNSAYTILLEDSISKVSRFQSDCMCIYGGMISSVCGILYATYLIQFMFIHYKTTSDTFQLVLISYKCLGFTYVCMFVSIFVTKRKEEELDIELGITLQIRYIGC